MRCFALVLVLSLIGCTKTEHAALPSTHPVAVADAGAPTAARHDVLAFLRRSPCFGRCPGYQLTIHSDGLVEYEGKYWVKRKGHAEAHITADEVAALRAAYA